VGSWTGWVDCGPPGCLSPCRGARDGPSMYSCINWDQATELQVRGQRVGTLMGFEMNDLLVIAIGPVNMGWFVRFVGYGSINAQRRFQALSDKRI